MDDRELPIAILNSQNTVAYEENSVGRFYYDKSTKTLYKYLHDRLEIKDIRCIHQGIDREKKDGSHFVSMNVQILNWKKQFSLCTIGKYIHIQRVLIINIHIICMIIT